LTRQGRTAAALARLDRQRGPRAEHDPMKPEVFALALDTREQLIGFIPRTIPVVVAKLPVGDLSVPGFEDRVAIDRKQLDDFVNCVTRESERFTRLLRRMAELDLGAIVVESTVAAVRAHKYRSQMSPAFVLGAAAHITAKYGVPVFFCGDLDASTDFATRLLRAWWINRGIRRELRAG
jgi:DNA excision repair protein ERCC-4